MLTTLLAPFIHGVSAVLATAHDTLVSLGAAPGSALTWTLSIMLLVVVVRGALLPLVVRQVQAGHAGARAHPQLAAIRKRYSGRTDRDSLLAQSAEMRAVRKDHGLGVASWLPLLVQMPVLSALYLVLRDVSAGLPVASMSLSMADSLAHASIGGLSLNTTLAAALGGAGGLLPLVAVVLALAVITYLTQRFVSLPNLPEHALDGPLGQVQNLMPPIATAGIVFGAFFVPAGIVLYWAASALWTLAQQATIVRFWPTPTSRAAARFAG